MRVITRNDLIDEVTSARALRERYPDGRIENLVEAVADVRAAMDECRAISNVRTVSGLSNDKTWMRMAHVPLEVVVFLEQNVDPNFFRDKKTFYRWLHRHPEYQTASYKKIG